MQQIKAKNKKEQQGVDKCVVVTVFSQNQAGFLDFSYRIKALNKQYQLTIVSNIKLDQSELQVEGAKYIFLPKENGILGWLLYLIRCAKLIRTLNPRVVILLHTSVSPISLLVGKIPTVTYWNEHPTHMSPAPTHFSPITSRLRATVRWLMFFGARRSSLTMPIGEAHRDDLLAHGCNPNTVQMLYMGVDQSFSNVALNNQLAPTNDHLKLIYVGSVQKDRGRDVMLEAIALANAANTIAHLTIVGAPTEQVKYCQEYAKKLHIENAVTIVGRVPGNSVPSYYSQADVGLCLWEDMPWYRFNPPTKLFEYLVAGLPVLASNIRTHTEYIQDGDNGLIFDYDSASLSQAIRKLWTLRNELPKMKQRAKDSSSVYLWHAIEPKFLNSILEVAR